MPCSKTQIVVHEWSSFVNRYRSVMIHMVFPHGLIDTQSHVSSLRCSILAITCDSVVRDRDDGAVYSEVCGDVLW